MTILLIRRINPRKDVSRGFYLPAWLQGLMNREKHLDFSEKHFQRSGVLVYDAESPSDQYNDGCQTKCV